MRKIKSFKNICKIVKKLQKEGKKIVFVNDVFDILHKGHVTLLVEAKKLGDVLVVGVDHDDNAWILKGEGRPIHDHQSRMFVLSKLEPVDYVFLIPSFGKTKDPDKINNFYRKLHLSLKADVIATCVRAGKHGHFKKKHAEAVGAKFVDIKHNSYDISTSKIIERLKNNPEKW